MEAEKGEKLIRVVCISDTHGRTDKLILPEGDILIHAGDFSSCGRHSEIKKFNKFMKKQKFKHKVVIAGNHELTFDDEQYDFLKERFNEVHNNPFKISSKEAKELLTDVIYLENSSVNLFGYNIYGSPYTPKYYDWAFMKEDPKDLRAIWEKIPTDTDILITHGPPYGILDKTSEGENVGCKDLLDIVLNKVKPKFHIYGHIHESNAMIEKHGINFINAAICNLYYQPNNPYYEFEIPDKTNNYDQNINKDQILDQEDVMMDES